MSFIHQIIQKFEAHSDQERAIKMKAYMKGKFEYYGIMATPRRDLIRSTYKE